MTKEELEDELIRTIERENQAAASLLVISQTLLRLLMMEAPIERGVLRGCVTDMNNLAKSLNDSAYKSIQAIREGRKP